MHVALKLVLCCSKQCWTALNSTTVNNVNSERNQAVMKNRSRVKNTKTVVKNASQIKHRHNQWCNRPVHFPNLGPGLRMFGLVHHCAQKCFEILKKWLEFCVHM